MSGKGLNALEKAVAAQLKQFLVFKIGTEEYGLDIQKVTTIIEKDMNISRVPQTPGYIKGVINLRGEIIPVMNLRIKFGMPETDDTEETRIIVIKLDDIAIGLIVDMVCEVIDLTDNQIEKVNSFSTSYITDYIMGVAKLENRIVTLLNLQKLITI
jgi:purine-binding chemotaxis protein CheW